MVSNKLYSRPNNIKGDKDCHFTIHSTDKIVMKIYLPNDTASKYIKLRMLEIKWEIYRKVSQSVYYFIRFLDIFSYELKVEGK